MHSELLRFKAVHQAVGLSRTTIWRLEKDGKFPARRKLSSNSVGWLRSSIEEWIQSRAIVGSQS